MAGFGLALLACVGVALILTGLPAYVALIFAGRAPGPGAAVASGVPARATGDIIQPSHQSVESDLPQALPLYVLMGALLNPADGGARYVPHLAPDCCPANLAPLWCPVWGSALCWHP